MSRTRACSKTFALAVALFLTAGIGCGPHPTQGSPDGGPEPQCDCPDAGVPPQVTTGTSVQPLRDGAAVFPAIASVVNEAENFVHLAIWEFDDEIRWSSNGQLTVLHSRSGTPSGAPMDNVEDLHCDNPPDPTSSIASLRCKAADLARHAWCRAAPDKRAEARGEVMVLVWDNYLDDSIWSPLFTNVGDLAYLLVKRSDLASWNDATLLSEMRRRGSGESLAMLKLFRDFYTKTIYCRADTLVPMPTGIAVMSQKNFNGGVPASAVQACISGGCQPAAALGASHHQKLLATERGAYVGGLNFGKEYWDNSNHVPKGSPAGAVRAGSGILATPVVGDPGPLHDTGSIVRGDLILDVNKLFTERWTTNNVWPWNSMTGGQNKPYVGLENAWFTNVCASNIRQVGDVEDLKRYSAVQDAIDKANAAAWTPVSVARQQAGYDPNFLVSDVTLATSRPVASYQGSGGPLALRTQYIDEIARVLPPVTSAAYFESQFFQDPDFTTALFNACNPKKQTVAADGRPRLWCPRDPYVHLVLPYTPGASGSAFIDQIAGQVESTVAEEMQNIVWLEVKTARTLFDRNTGSTLLWFDDIAVPPECRQICPHSPPHVYFVDASVDADPAKVSQSSVIDAWGTIQHRSLPCPSSTDPNRMIFCSIQGPYVGPVSGVITDASFMSYALVTSSSTTRVSGTGGNPATNYHNYLSANSIYIHSKHSEFFNPRTTRYAIGSANLNPRSLGHLRPKAGLLDDDDSEVDLFFTPMAAPDFWKELWTEHMGSLPPDAIVPDAMALWEMQGWSNLALIRGGGTAAASQRVVRLDAIERCQRIAGNKCP